MLPPPEINSSTPEEKELITSEAYTPSKKRIAKNTLMLYIRMLISLGVSLYTSRIVLNTLGIVDYGIYNVVGGLVTMLAFLSSSMSSATQRFLSFEIGRNDNKQVARMFSMSINIYAMIVVIIFVLAETVGLWFVNTQLNLPADRMTAANWVYQFSIFTFIISIISVPYNAIIIAYEKMNIYAWISIVDVVLKLIVVFILQWLGYDKLKLYAVLLFTVSVIIRIIYTFYCRKNFPESKFQFFWDKKLFKTLVNYASWNLWGNSAAVLFGQGVNILLNIFFGPAINAARGIAYAVRSAVNNFVYNFQVAVNPQIIKSFASNDLKYMHQLIFQSAKFSFFLLFILSLPILLETRFILQLWLGIVPDYTIIFTQLVLIEILINSISGPLMTAAQASGKIKLYQGVVGGLLLLIVPISYLFLKLGYPPQVTLYVSISIALVALGLRLLILRKLVKIEIKSFLSNVVFKVFIVSIISLIVPLILKILVEGGLERFILIVTTGVLGTITTTYTLGINNIEKLFIKSKINGIKYRIIK